MNEFGLAMGLLEREERRKRERRVFTHAAFSPDRRRHPDRRLRSDPHSVALEDEEIASLLGPPYES